MIDVIWDANCAAASRKALWEAVRISSGNARLATWLAACRCKARRLEAVLATFGKMEPLGSAVVRLE